MMRGHVVRLVVWAVLVVGIAAGGIAWCTRTVPAAVNELKAAPPVQTVTAEVDPFPLLTALVTRPLRWVRDGFVFLLEVLFLVGVVRGWVGRPLGIYELIHCERPAVRFVNGLVLGMAVGNCLFVLYAVNQEAVPWPVVEWPTLLPVGAAEGLPGEARPAHLAGNFLLVTWVPVLLLMGLGKPTRDIPWVGLGLAMSVAVGVGLVFAGWWALTGELLPDWRHWFALTPGAADGRIPPDGFAMHVIATGFTALPLLLIVLLFVAGKVGLHGSPVWVVCLSLWLFNAGYGFVSFHFGGLQFVLLLLLALVILAANVRHPYKLCLPGLGPEYAAARAGKPKPIGVTVSPVGAKRVPLLSAEELLTGFHDKWKKDHPDGRKPKLLIVCCSGGGIRAGVWTAAVLTELERQLGPAFGRHLRLITGASGGMLAAALYAGRQLVPTPGVSDAHALAKDSLWPTWQSLFFADTPSVVLPFFKNWDRAHALERSWARNTRGPAGRSPLQLTFAEMLPAELSGTAPSLVFSPLMVEDGRRLLVSNLDLSDLAVESAPTLAEPQGTAVAPRGRISQPAVEFFRLFPESHNRFALATAARLSATFPYVSPAVALPTAPARRVVDAGFFDNYGVGLAAGWLLRNRRLVTEHCGGVAVIEVRAFPLEDEKTGLPETLVTAGGGLLTTVLAGISTPAEALGVIQSAGAYYRNDHLLGILDDVFNSPERSEFFVRTSLECAGDGSLSWAVSETGRDDIVRAVGGVKGQIAGLKAWFGDGGSW